MADLYGLHFQDWIITNKELEFEIQSSNSNTNRILSCRA